jgi:hypothetical protein
VETGTDPFDHPAYQQQTLATNVPLATLLFLADPSELAIRSVRGQIETDDYAGDRLVSPLSMIMLKREDIPKDG